MANIFELFGEIIIKNTDANKKIDETTGKAKDLADALNKAGDGAKDAGEQLEDAGKKAETAGDKFGKDGKFSAAATALGNLLSELAEKAWDLSKQLFDMGISYNSNMEYYHASISSMLGGDAESAAKLIGQLQELSVNTPLHFLDLMKNTQSMLAYGVAADSVVDLLTMMGNITLGDTNKLNSLAYAFSQVVGYGYLRAQETNQMINAGFPVWELLSESMGKTAKELHIMSEEGQILPEHIIEAMQLATSEGGNFYNQMDAMMTTYNAKWEKIKETTEITAGTLTEPLFQLLRDEALPRIQGLLEKFSTFLEENPDLLESWAETLSDFAVSGFESLMNLFEYIVTNKDVIINAIDAIGTAFIIKLGAAHPVLGVILGILRELGQAKAEGRDITQLGLYEGMYEQAIQKGAAIEMTPEEFEAMMANAANRGTVDNPFDKYKRRTVDGEEHFVPGSGKLNEGYGIHRPVIGQWSVPVINSSDPLDYTKNYIETYIKNNLFTPNELENMVVTIATELETKGEAEQANELLKWWEGVKSKFNLTVTATVIPSLEGFDSQHGQSATPGFATGLDFVPRDNFIARLHKGEAVLTAKENSEYRQMKNGGDVGAAIAQLTDAINELQEGFQTNMNLYVNKKHVASALSRDMGRSIGNREYTLVRGMGG